LEHSDRAIALKPLYSEALRDRANLQSECPEAIYRDGPAALRDARLALDLARDQNELHSDWVQRIYLQTLVSAHAARGDFPTAIAVQKEVLERYCMTRAANEEARWRLIWLESNRPMHEPDWVLLDIT
jgi:hypothetical protein